MRSDYDYKNISSSNLDIDTNKILDEIQKMKSIKQVFEDLYRQVKKNTEDLKDDWISRTSESVFSDFPTFYEALENSIRDLNNDITYLEKVVKQGYENNNKATNNLVDEKIAM